MKPGFHLGYVRALDGLRGLAVVLVLLTHLDVLPQMCGVVGVALFFALSGFLITCLLIEEWDQTGRISLRAFYARRALRLLPALIAVVAAFLVYSHFCHSLKQQQGDLKEAMLALFYSMNWARALRVFWARFLGHTWTLSIEEQFYVIWPIVLLFLLRRTRRQSLFWILLLASAFAWLDRFLLQAATAAPLERICYGLDTRADALLYSCAAAVAVASGLLPQTRWWQPALKLGSAISFGALGLMCLLLRPWDAGLGYFGWFLLSLGSGIIVLQLVIAPVEFSNWALSSGPMVWLGRVSYGLYLWHQPILFALDESGMQSLRKYWYLRIGLPVLAAVLSYYLVERPFLRLKHRFEKAK